MPSCWIRAIPLRWSRHGTKVDLSHLANDEAKVLAALRDYARRLGGRPVVIPTSDALALMLASHRDSLQTVCRLWTTEPCTLNDIVCKEQLYRRAASAGVATIPCVADASMDEVAAWSAQHAGPYFLKPSYEAVAQSSVRGKNFIVETREQLLAFVAERGLRNAVVQRFIEGGDGEIYDSYGLCDREGPGGRAGVAPALAPVPAEHRDHLLRRHPRRLAGRRGALRADPSPDVASGAITASSGSNGCATRPPAPSM